VFTDELVTLVPIPDDVAAYAGGIPFTQVMYNDGDEMVVAGIFTSVKLTSVYGQYYVVVDHGGIASGVIKIK
jgi:hypothetical protein